jgi:hypothetical protein
MVKGTSDRRQFLAGTLGAAAALAGGGLLRPSAAQSALREIELRDNLKLVTGMGSNAIVLRAAGAAAVFDICSREHSTELAMLVRGDLGLLSV